MIVLWLSQYASYHHRPVSIWRIYWRRRWTPFARLKVNV